MSQQLTLTIKDLAKGIAAGSFRSEAEISQGVVKRILHDLGWPVFNMQVVAPEFKIGTRKVDYALCQPPGKAAVLMEVKDLGKADGKGQKQLFEYCFHQGVPIAVLTDGRTWSFFFPAGQGNYQERLFAKIDLLDDDHRDGAARLVRYLDWRTSSQGRLGKGRNGTTRRHAWRNTRPRSTHPCGESSCWDRNRSCWSCSRKKSRARPESDRISSLPPSSFAVRRLVGK